ncbi:Transglycosylase SLT domain protein [Photorhabdus australis subsp. thailandensis]|uniref:Transglycosylase SLT domain protein n=1 Tax=Photorhabdus australis subsp. thailandensis TaxID=2805096 RepID=A0A1C0U3V2_9GAMM|nr:lytic transglycosylase domain-containing protein [Photorhabdus australis]OCQ52563.1 Transglycosylase SLT domain protein [Photorhabdus australis subsp. thailandensis]
MKIKALLLIAAIVFCFRTHAFCFNEAGAKYRIDPLLLKAIATQESGLNTQEININRNKKGKILSIDYGLMQINSMHIPELKLLGIIQSKDDLLNNSCLNIQIGAWILAKHLQKCGINWTCLGSYNAGFKKDNDSKRMNYARKIYALYLPALQEKK